MTGACWRSAERDAVLAPFYDDGVATTGGLGRRVGRERGAMTVSHARLGGRPPCFCLNRHGWNRVRLVGWIGSEPFRGLMAVACAVVRGPG
jgi:hypothetical protein